MIGKTPHSEVRERVKEIKKNFPKRFKNKSKGTMYCAIGIEIAASIRDVAEAIREVAEAIDDEEEK